MSVAAGTATAATLQVALDSSTWNRYVALAPPAKADADAPSTAASVVVLPVLLPPGQELERVEAPSHARVVGTQFFHGHGMGLVAVDAAEGSPPASLTLVTRPARERIARRLRPDARFVLRTRRALDGLVINPGDLARYAPPRIAAQPRPAGGFKPTELPSIEGSAVDMLIVTRQALAAGFEAYAQARTAYGIPTVVRTVEDILAVSPQGADLPETLRGYIRQAYELWGIREVLLGGDTDDIPTRYATTRYSLESDEVPTDLYYACLDGSWNADGDAQWGEGYDAVTGESDLADLYPELYVGRVPVHDATEVAAYLAKLGRYLEPAVTDYQNRVLFLAEVLWPVNYVPGGTIFKNGADNAERLILLTQLANRGFTIDRLYETAAPYPSAATLTRQASIDAMNAGTGLVMHFGHGFRYTMSLGDQSLTNLQAATLTNQDRPFFLSMLNCTASAYDFPCLAEKFLLNPTGGAIGVIGASREAFPDNVQLYQEAWFTTLFADDERSAAQALHDARLRYLSRTFADGAFRWTNFIMTYLGDPTLPVWRGAPRTATVTHDATLSLGEQDLTITVTAGGSPVPGATVCLWKSGDFYAVGRTNFSGVAQLPVRIEAPGEAALTVQGAGVLPYRVQLPVQGVPGPALRATGAVQVIDSGAGTTGNGNGLLEASEHAQVRFEVRNEGGTVASAVYLLAQASDPFVQLLSQQVDVGDVAPGATVWSAPLDVVLHDGVLDQHHVRFDLALHAQGWTWSDQVGLDVLQVEPRVVGLDIVDPNGNKTPDANELYYLDVELKNYGFARLDAAAGTLFSVDPDVQIVEASATLGDLDHLSRGSLRFRVRETDVSQPNPLTLVLTNAAGRVWSFVLETRRPEPPSSLQADPSGGSNTTHLSWTASPSTDVQGYRILRRDTPTGPWQRASADLVTTTTSFRDQGLEPNHTYRYAVEAVDTSGNASWLSDVVTVTTNPAQNAGWPQALAQWSNCPPLVVDLDGDLAHEVLAGADVLYGWHADGSELLDGDANPSTPGVWAADGRGFVAGLAAADLDGDGLDEVVACSWDTREVYVYDGDGSVLPGWPRPIVSTTHAIWATPAIADLDLDGTLEVIVEALDGRVYAWHADGSEVVDGDQDPATQGVFYALPGLPTWGRGAPAVGNLRTEDAEPEIVFGAGNQLYMLRANGTPAPGWPRDLHGEVTAAPSLGDIDADGELEIAVPSRAGSLYVFNADATLVPGWPQPLETNWAALTPSVALHDFDGDGPLELVVAGSSGDTYEGTLTMFDWTGSTVAGWPVDVSSASEATPLIGDVDNDAVPEILFGGESGLLYGFRPDGSPAPGFPIKLGAELRATPVLTDVDRDGDVDLVVSGWDQQVYVYDFKGGYVRSNVPWGMFKGNARRNGLYAWRLPTDTAEDTGVVPRRTRLYPNVPNPFNPATTIRFELAGPGRQRALLRIFDVQGRLVRTLVDSRLPAGVHQRVWNGRDALGRPAASGVYFYRLDVPGATRSRKMILVR